MSLDAADTAGVVVFVFTNSDIGERGDAVVMRGWWRRRRRSGRVMVLRKRGSLFGAIFSCIRSGARISGFGMPDYHVRAGSWLVNLGPAGI